MTTSSPSQVVVIPDNIWQQMLDEFAKVPAHVERVAYLDGYRMSAPGTTGAAPAVVTSVALPDAQLFPGRYTVSADAMSEAGRHFRATGMVRLAQVHTHSNTWVDHSRTDDDNAYSNAPGALSIVIPNHGAGSPGLDACGVHVRADGRWIRIPAQVHPDYVQITPTVRDFRRYTWTTQPTNDQGTFSRLLAWLRPTPRSQRR